MSGAGGDLLPDINETWRKYLFFLVILRSVICVKKSKFYEEANWNFFGRFSYNVCMERGNCISFGGRHCILSISERHYCVGSGV